MWGTSDDGGFGKSRFEQTGAGGGFLNSSTVDSPNTSEKKKPERITNVVPCTIAQIHLIPDDKEENLSIGSLSAKIITFVGFVRSSEVQTTKVTYLIDDGTGPSVEVHMWLGETDDPNKIVTAIEDKRYCRVTGAIRSMKGKRHVIAFNIHEIHDGNEIAMHIAEVIHTSMAVAVMDKQSASNTGFGSTALLTSGMNDSSMDTFGSSSSRKLTKAQQLVKQAIVNCKDEQGIDVAVLFSGLKSLTRPSIQEALDFLSNEGHIYSTIDDEHFKSTDCD